MRKSRKQFYEGRLRYAQDKVLQGYVERFELLPNERHRLHMFFSPTRVPKGLTKEEVHIVLLLSTLRELHKKVSANQFLPREMMPAGRMTRRGFEKGITKLLYTMTTL